MIVFRFIFALLPLLFTLVLKISSAPILDLQLLPTKLGENLVNETLTITTTESLIYDDDDDDDSKESNENELQTTTSIEYSTESSQSVTNGLVFKDSKNISLNIDEILDLTARLLHYNFNELPSTPTTENPKVESDDD